MSYRGGVGLGGSCRGGGGSCRNGARGGGELW